MQDLGRRATELLDQMAAIKSAAIGDSFGNDHGGLDGIADLWAQYEVLEGELRSVIAELGSPEGGGSDSWMPEMDLG